MFNNPLPANDEDLSNTILPLFIIVPLFVSIISLGIVNVDLGVTVKVSSLVMVKFCGKLIFPYTLPILPSKIIPDWRFWLSKTKWLVLIIAFPLAPVEKLDCEPCRAKRGSSDFPAPIPDVLYSFVASIIPPVVVILPPPYPCCLPPPPEP